MNIWHAFILGAVQGVTEFLPISSTGHLTFAQDILAIQSTLSFDVFLHVASLAAIVFFFRSDIRQLRFQEYRFLAIGTLPAIVVGLVLEGFLKTAFVTPFALGGSFIFTGGVNFIIHTLLKHPPAPPRPLTEKSALTIGLFQAVAIIPAISRSGTTLLGSLWSGLEKERAFSFTFLLAIPAIVSAGGWQLFRLLSEEAYTTLPLAVYGVGGLTSLVTSLWGLHLLRQLLVRSHFRTFGWYCLVLGSGILIAQLIR